MSIYRELFVELPLAILGAAVERERARGQAEIGSRRVEAAKAFGYRPVTLLSSRAAERTLSTRYGWLGYELRHEEYVDAVALLVTWRCWHRARLTLSGLALLRTRDTESLLELLDDVEAAGRPCSCVQRPV